MSKISVVVPVFKVEPFINRCIDSILHQSFYDFDLILVDDGSPDNCGFICDEYAKKDNRVIVIHKDNGGLSDARNVGIEWAFANSKSEWITFIDSDDWVHPYYLEFLYNAVISTGLSVALVRFERTTGKDLKVSNEKNLIKTIKTEDLYCNSYKHFITAWGKLYKKADFQYIRYPQGKLHEDEFTTWKILFLYPEIAMVDAPLYAYFVNETSITQSNWDVRRIDGLEAQKERIAAIDNNPSFINYRVKTIVLTAHTIAGYIQTLERQNMSEKDKFIRRFRMELRDFLKSHKNEIPVDKFGWVYEKAYPCLMSFRAFITEMRDIIRSKFFCK